MASIVFNTGKGRFIEIYRNLKLVVRPNAALIVVLLQANEGDSGLADRATLFSLLDDVNNEEATFTNYSRKTLIGTDLDVFPSPNNVDDAYEVSLPNLPYMNAGGATNNILTRCIICYVDDATSPSDADIVPMLSYDYNVTTDGSSLLIEFPADALSAS